MSVWSLEQASFETGEPLQSLEELSYCCKAATQLAHLVTLTSLKSLNVSFNALHNLDGIQSLQSLQRLNISHNQLTSLDPLTGLQSLTQLNCSHNRVSCTTSVVQLTGLKFLALHSNNISTAADVVRLSCLTCLQHLTLCQNPVCGLVPDWQHATIAVAPSLQALDSAVITPEQLTAAGSHSDTWAAAAAMSAVQLRSSSCTAAGSLDEGGTLGGTPAAASSSLSRTSNGWSRRSSTSSSGRLRHRVASGALTAAGMVPDDSISIKDATSLLPSMSLKPLKPSSLVRRAAEVVEPSLYGYSRAKPIRVLQKQLYQPSGSIAVLVHSDGSASCTWPEGNLAASLDPEDAPPAGSTAASSGGAVSSSTSSVAPIRGYRLLAMYRSVTAVAASFDSTGGFVQWPSGGLMLVWNKRDGTAYHPDGSISHSWTNRRRAQGFLAEDIVAQLDDHFSVKFLARSQELQLHFNCDDCQVVLSQRHGVMLPSLAVVQQPTLAASSAEPATMSGHAAALQRQQDDAPRSTNYQAEANGTGAAQAVSATADGLPGADEMQALLARARALMAATDAEHTSDSCGQAEWQEGYDSGVPVAHVQPDDEASSTVDRGVLAAAGSEPGRPAALGVGGAGCSSGDPDLHTMMARARAAMAETTAILQDLQL